MSTKIVLQNTIVIILALLPALAFSGNESAIEKAPPQKSTLIIHRARYTPPLMFKPMIVINSVKAFRLPRGYHAALELDPGEYNILADWKKGHGVADKTLDVKLSAGETAYIAVGSSVDVSMIAFGGVNIHSNLSSGEATDLSNSIKITRWHAQWLNQAVGGFTPEETLNQRYSLSIDNAALVADFERGNNQEKYKIARYLLAHELYEEEILMSFEKEVLATYKNNFKNKEESVPLIFICKYIAASQMEEFKGTIKKVHKEAADKRVSKYARSFMTKYYGIEL